MGRVLDRGAIFAGWVSAGMAAVIVLSFELVVPPTGGLLRGATGGPAHRSRRKHVLSMGRRPVGAGWPRTRPNAGLVTGPTLALLHGAIRLLFFSGDAGFSAGSQGGAVTCRSAADCTCQRYLAPPVSAAELRAAGITDASGVERYS